MIFESLIMLTDLITCIMILFVFLYHHESMCEAPILVKIGFLVLLGGMFISGTYQVSILMGTKVIPTIPFWGLKDLGVFLVLIGVINNKMRIFTKRTG